MKAEIIVSLGCWFMLQLHLVSSQSKCDSDTDCPENLPCCSSFGYCGEGEGFCFPSATTDAGLLPKRRDGVFRSGAGCSVTNVEYVGGDLPVTSGGGGFRTDRNTSRACFDECEDNFRCRYFTYDVRNQFCYLKTNRGYPRNRTSGFISGSTDRDGCDKPYEPECDDPYSYYQDQCMFYCDEGTPYGTSLADVRRTYNSSRNECGRYNGYIPYEFRGAGGYRNPDQWHWLGYRGEGNDCWAGRPSYWQEGIRSFPCSSNLNFACQRNGKNPPVIPPRPSIYSPRRKTTNLNRLLPINTGHRFQGNRGFGRRRSRLSIARRLYLLNRLALAAGIFK